MFQCSQYLGNCYQVGIGEISFYYSPNEIADGARTTGFVEIAISSEHAAGVELLPMHHADPFDPLLVAQALVNTSPFGDSGCRTDPLFRMDRVGREVRNDFVFG